jgi:Integrase core domain
LSREHPARQERMTSGHPTGWVFGTHTPFRAHPVFPSVFVAQRPCSGGMNHIPGTHRVTRTPIWAPRANTIAERFVGTIRRECLDRVLILGSRPFMAVLDEFVDDYSVHRPHRSLGQAAPCPSAPTEVESATPTGSVVRTNRMGGLIHEYRLVA